MGPQSSDAAAHMFSKAEVCLHSSEAAATDRPAADVAACFCSGEAKYLHHTEATATCFPL